jgi:hypothetical protein
MKNLKESAEVLNLYKVEDIPAIYKNDYFEHRIKCNHKEIPEFLLNCKLIEIGLFYECKQDTNYEGKISYYVDNSYILVKAINSDLLLMLMCNRDKKYYLHPHYNILNKYNNITYHLKTESLKGLSEPNYIGVFTDKKIIAWLEYCYEYITRFETLYNTVNNANEAIKNEIEVFINSLPEKNVQRYQNRVYVDTPLFNVIFEHFKDQKYLSTKIEYKGGLQNITKIANL